MDILFVWLTAFIPLICAGVAWLFFKKIEWFHALIMTAIGLAICGVVHLIAVSNMTNDKEMWSGQVTCAKHIPAWLEYYEYAVYRTEYYTEEESYTDSKGNTCYRTVTKSRQVFDHWEPSTRNHPEKFIEYDTLDHSEDISKEFYNEIKGLFGNSESISSGTRSTWDHNSRMLSGDPNDYQTINSTNYVYPVHELRSWTNKIKAAPSVFSFSKVPEGTNVYEYPEIDNRYVSNRLIGPIPISVRDWDQLNATLGPMMKVNLIMINFGNKGEDMAEWQRAKWVGGKKNDIVMCYGTSGNNNKADWVKIFGWSESELAKVQLQNVMLDHKIDSTILPLIKDIIIKEYDIKDWSKFDYLSVEISWNYLWIIFIIHIGSIIGGYFLIEFIKNVNDDTPIRSYYRRNY
jgi:hypothetical protein